MGTNNNDLSRDLLLKKLNALNFQKIKETYSPEIANSLSYMQISDKEFFSTLNKVVFKKNDVSLILLCENNLIIEVNPTVEEEINNKDLIDDYLKFFNFISSWKKEEENFYLTKEYLIKKIEQNE